VRIIHLRHAERESGDVENMKMNFSAEMRGSGWRDSESLSNKGNRTIKEWKTFFIGGLVKIC
jgi:hypothetical protein